MKKNAHLRIIINADSISVADNIFENINSKIKINKDSLTELKQYEDEYHYEVSFSVELFAEDYSELEYKTFKLCTTLADGPWLFLRLPEIGKELSFEAIFNHEAFINNAAQYTNKLKWAHLEID